MRKIIIPAIALLCMCNTSKANDDDVKYNIFYGSKASGNANNPCKGATIRVCGKLVATFTVISDNETNVNEKLIDADDNILRISDYNMKCSIDAAKSYFDQMWHRETATPEEGSPIFDNNED